MGDSYSYKSLTIKRFGWKRVAYNNMRFGWDCDQAEEHTTTTTQRSYTGEIIGDKLHIKEHVNTSSKIRIHLSFSRCSSDYNNFPAIIPFEILYNICFYARRIIGFFLPFLLGAVAIIAIFGGADGQNMLVESGTINWFFGGFCAWLGLIFLEGLFSRIAGKILGIKIH